jgi:hypothetical protein
VVTLAVPFARLEKLVNEGAIHRNHQALIEILLKRNLINETHLEAHVSPIVEKIVGHHANRGVIDVSKVTDGELKRMASEIKVRGTSH